METKKVIIWDFDGPIVDSYQLAFERTLHHYHDVTKEMHRDLFNGNIHEELEKLRKKDSAEIDPNFVRESYWRRKIEAAPVLGMIEAIKTLNDDYEMVINSSGEGDQICTYLDRHNLSPFFKKVYGAEIKSKVEKFKLILDEFKVTAKDCIMITDTLGDVLEAKKVGIPSVVILWGYQFRRHFGSVKERVVFAENPSELPSIIKKHFNENKT